MLFFMLAAFLPLVLACDVFLLGTATVDTSLYVNFSDYQLIQVRNWYDALDYYIHGTQCCQRFYYVFQKVSEYFLIKVLQSIIH